MTTNYTIYKGEFTCIVPTFHHFLLWAWIFESLKLFTKSLQTFHKWSNQSPLLKKLNLDYPVEILVLLKSPRFYLYNFQRQYSLWHLYSFEKSSCWTEIFEYLQEITKSLAFDKKTKFWPLEFTCDRNILPLSFTCLNFSKFKNCYEIAWNLSQMIESDSMSCGSLLILLFFNKICHIVVCPVRDI